MNALVRDLVRTAWKVSSLWRTPEKPAPGYNWIPVADEDANTDMLPELGPCPTCGSVWTDVTAVGFRTSDLDGELGGTFIRGWMAVKVVLPHHVYAVVSRVRVRCASGHVVETDSRTFSEGAVWDAMLPEVAVTAAYMTKMARKLGLK